MFKGLALTPSSKKKGKILPQWSRFFIPSLTEDRDRARASVQRVFPESLSGKSFILITTMIYQYG
jgi:hypothetical protein